MSSGTRPRARAFSVDVHSAEDAVIVLVSDAGPGIADPEAALARGAGSGADGSTGLGWTSCAAGGGDGR